MSDSEVKNLSVDAHEDHQAVGQDDAIKPAGKSNPLHVIVFLICGTGQLYYWNSLLNMIGDVGAERFPEYPHLSDTLTVSNQALTLTCALLMTWRGNLSWKLNITGGIILLCVQLLTAVTIQAWTGYTGYVMLHLIAAISGIGTGTWQSGHYALAACMPVSCSKWVAFGTGIAGIFTFCVYMLLSEVCFPENIMGTVWTTCSIGCALIAIALAATVYLSRIPEVHAGFEAKKQQMIAERNDPNRPSYWAILKECWVPTVGTWFIYFVTLFVFPAFGPFRWPISSSTKTNVIMGMFQTGDFIGSGLPGFVRWLPFIWLGTKTLYISIIIRGILCVLFGMLMWRQPDVAMWGNFGWQIILMLFLSITNGWFSSLTLTRGPLKIADEKYRGRAATITLIGLLIGISSGLWTSFLVVNVVDDGGDDVVEELLFR